ncbi:lactate permease LctP family transporter [Wohlfahrtiimonas chitiniclastica]|uniref:L-lactate permease n=2 Tax=Wohlfahrtiimonas chitiniclastica TaxID=400946 RepID=L8XYY6_9GAMM|nr:lactate permease LctP family transporter [Wohlfahrtiimonas chitiniclastica]ELV09127.1 Glycolate permease glcA [Wohlfahrtiimonas chitiniclastica SH04]MBS7817133.1 lactate permease LctP family transporter [Wohlfahrtiimonas chitiniclastica]MBS7818864.1 lactate permease LctP family transporter [Wohlfahrtiimonas chitiniclastica]MBS7823012.1 lactate permease LctP family transporter [Wohlfahrtiimonas chitiniclastica]MBS7824058.1 lactate permease LctP family transporter [Wohlfahrtiimonas chitinicla
MTWMQNYTPIMNLGVSSLFAVLPIVTFFLCLTVFKIKGYLAGLLTLSMAILVAIFVYDMPVTMAFAASGYGFVYGLWPIAWIIITAVFLYKIAVKTGQFDIIRSSIISITEDQRLQLLLVGFAFGAFLEGAAGFGAPVAITAALLVGLGFKPLYAAGLCLIANTAPVAFGAMGIPIIVAGEVSHLDAFHIGQVVGRQLPILSIIVPFWLVAMMDGWRGVRQTWPAVLVSGVSFAITQFLTANFVGPELPDITSALVSLICLTLFLRVWQPKEIFTFDGQRKPSPRQASGYSMKQIFIAWSPFIVLTIMVTLWSFKSVQALLTFATFKFEVPFLHNLVMKAAPIVEEPTAYAAVYTLNILGAVGTSILIACVISMVILRMKVTDGIKTFTETLYELRMPILSIGLVLGFAFIANYSGLSSTLALLLAQTGVLFPFFAPFLGWLGVFLTGSDTSSNALFSSLQANVANQLNVTPELLVAANTTGGVTGKMISPQSIAVACAATGIVGKESELFRFTVKHSLIFCSFVGLLTILQAYVMPWTLIFFNK